MNYYLLEPEVAGNISESAADRSVHPPRIEKLHYEFEGWQGDEILTAFPIFIVSEALKKSIEGVEATGHQFDEVEVSTSETFDELHREGFLPAIPAGQQLPQFYWLQITGRPGQDDFGQAGIEDAYSLVVSERILQVFQRHRISQCFVEEYLKC